MEIEKPLTIEEADAFYEWFLDLYGRKRAKAELKQSGKDGWKEGFKEGFIESFTESFTESFIKSFTEILETSIESTRKKTCETIVHKMLEAKYPLDEISKLTDMDMMDILKLAKDNNLLDV